MVKVTLKHALECKRCGHGWTPRIKSVGREKAVEIDVRICPKCKSPYWDKPSGRTVQRLSKTA